MTAPLVTPTPLLPLLSALPRLSAPRRAPAADGSSIDGGLYTQVTDWARTAPGWVDDLVKYWSELGLVVFAVLMVAALWWSRRQSAQLVARALAVPVVVVLAYGISEAVKSAVREVQPCVQLPHDFTLVSCSGRTDWAFPSNHTIIAFAAASGLFLVNRTLGVIALVAAVAMGLSRVYVGAHYPHDVLAGALLGVVIAVPLVLLAGRYAGPLVERVRGRG